MQTPPQTGRAPATSRSRAGWLLVGGLALTVLGLVTQPGGATTAAPPGLRLPFPGAIQPPLQDGTNTGGNDVRPTGSLPSIGSGYGTADSNGAMIAVTGIDVTGGSLLYVIDTQAKQLAVYQAQGGTSSTNSLRFVGGRRIGLDLQVYGYNDESDYSYEELSEEFEANGIAGPGDGR